MAISWVAKKKLTYIGVLMLVLLVPISLIIWSNLPKPSCTDGKQNQQESGVDCGGPCTPCVAKPVKLIVHWEKPFKIGEGKYDVAALIENPNQFYGVENIEYEFRIYDEKNILIAQKKGGTFINPQEKFLIFEPNIDTGLRVPVRAFVELSENPNWKYMEKQRPPLSIINKNFINDPFAKFDVSVKNNSLNEIADISAGAILVDSSGNAFACSVVSVDDINGDEIKQVTFTWPRPLEQTPATNEVYFRVNLTK